MPRKSKAELETPLVATPIEPRRPPPPPHLSADEAMTWSRIVGTKPADWFRPDTHDLLVQFCRHVATANFIQQHLLEAQEHAEGRSTWEDYLKLRERESRAMLALARSMRITQQARLDKKTAANQHDATPEGRRPWEPAR